MPIPDIGETLPFLPNNPSRQLGASASRTDLPWIGTSEYLFGSIRLVASQQVSRDVEPYFCVRHDRHRATRSPRWA